MSDTTLPELPVVAWMFPRAYGSGLSFTRPDGPLEWDDERPEIEALVRLSDAQAAITADRARAAAPAGGALRAALVELIRLDDQYRPDPAPHEWANAWEAARAALAEAAPPTQGEKP